ncbi:UNVERIFIED_CONTAM: hypothetical protein GTU68_008153 [Idotea baltica]|nr:hypothetical protein [Idotea baltica]
MEGVVDHTMRELLTTLGGIDRCVTEFVRVTSTLLPPRVFRRLCPELDNGGRTTTGVPVYIQLLGGQATVIAENAARAAELGALGVDLNFGCPAKTVNRSDGGAIVLQHPDRVHNIVAAARRAVPGHIPLTVKIRLGYEDSEQFLDLIRAIDDAEATELVVHARTKRHGYRPPAFWAEIAAARQLTRIPIVANGEIWTTGDAIRCRALSQCSDLMLGRGALCRPDLPRLVKAAIAGDSLTPMSWREVLPLVAQLYHLNLVHYEERYAPNPVKQWLVYLRSYYLEASVVFEDIKRLHSPPEIRAVLERAIAQSSGADIAA